MCTFFNFLFSLFEFSFYSFVFKFLHKITKLNAYSKFDFGLLKKKMVSIQIFFKKLSAPNFSNLRKNLIQFFKLK